MQRSDQARRPHGVFVPILGRRSRSCPFRRLDRARLQLADDRACASGPARQAQDEPTLAWTSRSSRIGRRRPVRGRLTEPPVHEGVVGAQDAVTPPGGVQGLLMSATARPRLPDVSAWTPQWPLCELRVLPADSVCSEGGFPPVRKSRRHQRASWRPCRIPALLGIPARARPDFGSSQRMATGGRYEDCTALSDAELAAMPTLADGA